MALVNSIASKSRKPLVLVVAGGGPLDVSFAKGNPQIASILWIGYPGEAGGKALAEVIFGEYNPGWYHAIAYCDSIVWGSFKIIGNHIDI